MTENRDQDPMIKKIQALLDKADSTEFGPEAEALRAKADHLMVKFAVEQFQLDELRTSRGEARSQTAVAVETEFAYVRGMHSLMDLFRGVHYSIGNRTLFKGYRYEGGTFAKYTVVGFEADLAYAEMLLLSLRIQMLKMMMPEPDPSLTFDQNVYALHEAGLKWELIKDEMNKARANGAPWREVAWHPTNHDSGSLRAAAKRWAKATGDTYHTVVNMNTYREDYAEAFVNAISRRLRGERNTEPGTGLVLARRQEEVDALWDSLIPKPTQEELNAAAKRNAKPGRVAKVKYRSLDAVAASRGRAAGEKANLTRPGSNVSGGPTKRLGA